ncbi:hypothetical protein U0E23_17320 [Burkholderia stagnalis]|uniref:hypothetical protein n=1 Tax=Burkholderia stagnalis TaxID=1503054 RepID=UPI002AB4B933|nr:hypothetical protein [Burkholderia stagnalis]MDY7804207.1 hypothetical protein [Burkholderia stagnalis]
MRDLLDDFIERNMIAPIIASPKIPVHPGVHGIDARISGVSRTSVSGTNSRRRQDMFRSPEFF